jgi:hypothetical protein
MATKTSDSPHDDRHEGLAARTENLDELAEALGLVSPPPVPAEVEAAPKDRHLTSDARK